MKLKKFVVVVAIPKGEEDMDENDIAGWIIEKTETGVGVEVVED